MVYTTYKNGDLGDGLSFFTHIIEFKRFKFGSLWTMTSCRLVTGH